MNRILFQSRRYCSTLYEKFRGFHNEALESFETPGTTIVRTENHAKEVIKILKRLKNR